jgi:hypothetical protein
VDSMQEFYLANSFFLWLGTAFVVVVLLIWVLALQSKLNRAVHHYQLLTTGAEGGNVEEMLNRQLARAHETALRLDDVERFTRELDQSLRRAVQRVGLVRFNPFNDTGGDQSFAIAFLDAHGDGIVFSSIFSRKESRVYAKAVHRGDSRYPLSDEERNAIRQAVEEGSTGAKA